MTKTIYFITSNSNKLSETIEILGDISPFVLKYQMVDLSEYQGEPEEIAHKKCHDALKLLQAPVLVEDSSLCFNALNGLPGPYIKWFLKKIKLNGLFNLLHGYDDKSAYALSIFGFGQPGQDTKLFKGHVNGTIVEPRGNQELGWEPIFLPNGADKTFGEMTQEEKNEISDKRIALKAFKEFLMKNENFF